MIDRFEIAEELWNIIVPTLFIPKQYKDRAPKVKTPLEKEIEAYLHRFGRMVFCIVPFILYSVTMQAIPSLSYNFISALYYSVQPTTIFIIPITTCYHKRNLI